MARRHLIHMQRHPSGRTRSRLGHDGQRSRVDITREPIARSMIAGIVGGAAARVEAGHRDVARNEASPVRLRVKWPVRVVRADEEAFSTSIAYPYDSAYLPCAKM